jgi:hypothetical protein
MLPPQCSETVSRVTSRDQYRLIDFQLPLEKRSHNMFGQRDSESPDSPSLDYYKTLCRNIGQFGQVGRNKVIPFAWIS